MLLGEQIAWPDPFNSSAAIPEVIILANFLIWLPQVRFASMSRPGDFDIDTWFTGVPLILRTGETVTMFSFRLDPISINSVLVNINCEFVSDQPFADI